MHLGQYYIDHTTVTVAEHNSPCFQNFDPSYYMRQIYVDTAILSMTRALHLANVKYWFKNYRLHVCLGVLL